MNGWWLGKAKIAILCDQALIHAALTMAVARRKPSGEVILHSDRESQYCAFDYQAC